jgi:benzoyl-CoA reductase subunit B
MNAAVDPTDPILGRGQREGARLFRDWFAELGAAAEQKRPCAYVFVMGSLNEILRSFDLPVVFPEINSLQTAVRRVSAEYLSEAEDYGYSPDICGYVKADVAVQLRGGQHPMGRIPPPAIAIATNACNTYIKWAEFWERTYHIPVLVVDIPGSRSAGGATRRGDPDYEADLRYVEAQVEEVIRACETLTGRRFDVDRCREVLEAANVAGRAWRRVLALNRSQPAVFNALTDGTIYLGVANGLRGSAAAASYFTDLVEEMEWKAARGIGTLPEEKHRLAFVGVPCYPIFRRFNELFTARGGCFVHSTYLQFASGGANVEFEYDLRDPIGSLAEGLLVGCRDAMDSMFHQDRALLSLIDPYAIEGIVYHPIKSCRTVSTGLADGRRHLTAQRDIATLFLESDMMDPRVVSEAQMKNRIDAFFEGLASRGRARAREQAGAGAAVAAAAATPERDAAAATRQGVQGEAP